MELINPNVVEMWFNTNQISNKEYEKYILSESNYFPKRITNEDSKKEICMNKPSSYRIINNELRCYCCNKLVNK